MEVFRPTGLATSKVQNRPRSRGLQSAWSQSVRGPRCAAAVPRVACSIRRSTARCCCGVLKTAHPMSKVYDRGDASAADPLRPRPFFEAKIPPENGRCKSLTFWCHFGPHGEKRSPKMEPKWSKNRLKKRSKNECLFWSLFWSSWSPNRCQNGAKLGPKSEPTRT